MRNRNSLYHNSAPKVPGDRKMAMRTIPVLLIPFLTVVAVSDENDSRIKELNKYWQEVSRSVGEGDFESYAASCHPDGILVAGTSNRTQPLSVALARWKQGFADTKSGRIKASVEFRFSKRIGNATSAHETGMFLYMTVDADGKETRHYIHMEGLLTKKKGRWVMLMEYQKSNGTKEEWDALSKLTKTPANKR